MGADIAAHLVNAGLDVRLSDVESSLMAGALKS